MTVQQYEVKFSRLSKYAPKLVDTEESRQRCFWLGLDMDIQKALVSTKYDTYADLVEYAQRAETVLGKVKTRKAVKRTWTGIKEPRLRGNPLNLLRKSQVGHPKKGQMKMEGLFRYDKLNCRHVHIAARVGTR